MEANGNPTENQPVMNTHNEEEASLKAMLACSGQIYSCVLNAAVKLNLFDIIARSPDGAPMSPSDIASQLPTQRADAPQRLDRMLRLLASYSLLDCSSRINEDGSIERLYGLSPTAKCLLTDADGASYASVLNLNYHPTFVEVWQHFKEATLDGSEDLFKKVHGKPVYKYAETDPTLKQVFHKAMADLCVTEMNAVLKNYKGFEGISTLVDVGGGIGQSLKMIICKYPTIKGINFDLPQVIQNAPSYPGIEHVGGDMFQSVPTGDALMMKSITHNWTDEKCIQFLSNCHDALKKGGKLIVMDLIMPETPGSHVAKFVSLLDNMMFIQPGGRERTEREFQALCKGAGFSEFQVASRTFFGLGVMEFYK